MEAPYLSAYLDFLGPRNLGAPYRSKESSTAGHSIREHSIIGEGSDSDSSGEWYNNDVKLIKWNKQALVDLKSLEWNLDPKKVQAILDESQRVREGLEELHQVHQAVAHFRKTGRILPQMYLDLKESGKGKLARAHSKLLSVFGKESILENDLKAIRAVTRAQGAWADKQR